MQLIDRIIIPAFASRKRLSNSELYFIIRRRAGRSGLKLSAHWQATIRNTLQRHAKGNPKCRGKPQFRHLAPGRWEILASRKEPANV
jgi:hypothetical protein